jgi:hypothetical protein
MGRRLAIAMLTASVLAPAWASPLQAQRRQMPMRGVPPLMALALHDLTFGTVLPGIPSTVSVNDPLHAGLFEIKGPANASVRVELVLPTFTVMNLFVEPLPQLLKAWVPKSDTATWYVCPLATMKEQLVKQLCSSTPFCHSVA